MRKKRLNNRLFDRRNLVNFNIVSLLSNSNIVYQRTGRRKPFRLTANNCLRRRENCLRTLKRPFRSRTFIEKSAAAFSRKGLKRLRNREEKEKKSVCLIFPGLPGSLDATDESSETVSVKRAVQMKEVMVLLFF